MRKFLQRLLSKPVSRIADKYSSRPNKDRIHKALTELYNKISTGNEKKGLLIPFENTGQKFIIFSDQHRGAKNGSDDFAYCEKNYLSALDHYNQEHYHLISLGDSEELWENSIPAVEKHNVASFENEKLFLKRDGFTKVFGNHDLDWDNSPLAGIELQKIYGEKVSIYEGVILRTIANGKPLDIFLTHGHQGDELSDGNWFSKWFVANIWAPLQSYLSINPNTPAYEDHLKTDHNRFMYEWIAQRSSMLLITGHTHQPVFQSMTQMEGLYRKLGIAKEANNEEDARLIELQIQKKKLKGQTLPDFTGYKPTYFNSGCCCFNDGDITGIEIADQTIRLVKWEYSDGKTGVPGRILLDEVSLVSLI